MGADIQTSFRSHLYGTPRTREVVSPVYVRESPVVTGLDTVLHDDHVILGQTREIIQFLLVHTVRTRSYDYTRHVRMGEGLRIKPAKHF